MAFQGLRRTGLALSLGLTALAAFQGIRDAMADQPQAQRRRLDASGPREVVYCHQCENEWFRDESGLICPRCDCEATEIISAENDIRPPEIPAPPPVDELRDLRNYNPWQHHDQDSDPEEGDIREFVRDTPHGRTTFISRTFRGSPREVFASGSSRRPLNPDDPTSQTLRDFEGIISGILGSNAHGPGPQGEHHNPPPQFTMPGTPAAFFPAATAPNGQPRIFGGRVTFQFGGNPRVFHSGEDQGPQPQDLNTIFRDLMNVLQPPGGTSDAQNPLGGFHGLLSGLLNPANAVSGDGVYTQEALDRIISTLMEQHPTSNAPGPASEEAIAAIPKKKIDEKMLGPEGKAECSVCMDDVVLDEEVMLLPCNHWFHEACVKAWLGEHNTCPICRTGVARDGTALPAGSNAPANPANPANTGDDNHNDPFEALETLPLYGRRSVFLRRRPSINEARLSSIRNTAGLDQEQGQDVEISGMRLNPSSRRERSVSPSSDIPGAFSSTSNRNAIFRRQESDTDAGSTGRRDREREIERERNRNIEDGNTTSERGRPGSEHSNNSSASMGGTIGSWFRRFSGGGSGRRNN